MVNRDKQELENLRRQRQENDRKEKELEQRETTVCRKQQVGNEIAANVIDEEGDPPIIQPSAPSRRKQRQRTDLESSTQSVSHQEFQSHFDFLGNQMLMMNQNFSATVNRMNDLYQGLVQQRQAPIAVPMLTTPPKNYPRASTGIGREMISPIPPVHANVDLISTELTPAFRPPALRKRPEIALPKVPRVQVYVSEEE